MSTTTSPETENKPLVNFLAGGIGNSAAKTFLAPLSRLVVVMQLDDQSKNVVRTARVLWHKEGLRGCFRGNMTMMIHRVPYSGIQLLIYDEVKFRMRDWAELEESGFFMKMIAGGVSGCVSTICCFPLDVVRTRLMSLGSDYRGIISSLGRIVKEEGYHGLYKGIFPTVLQRVPDLCVHFAMYETVKFSLLRRFQDTLGWTGCTLGASSVAGFSCVTATLPMDVIRRRMMMDGAGGQGKQYRNLFHCGFSLFRSHGFVGLYRGYTVELTRVVPQVCLSWYLIESLRRICAPVRV